MIAHSSQINLKMKFLEKQQLFQQGKKFPHSNLFEVAMAATLQYLENYAINKLSYEPRSNKPRKQMKMDHFFKILMKFLKSKISKQIWHIKTQA